MRKEIDIQFSVNDIGETVPVSYTVEMNDDVQTINCMVNTGSFHVPTWLQIKRFELKSIYSDGCYAPLFTDNENIKNMHAALFIDKAYTDIMAKEKFKMSVVEEA